MKHIKLHNPLKVVIRDEVFTGRSTEPRIKVVESEGKDIIDYRIEEAKLDQDGNIMPTVKPPFYQTTGRSLEWTIKKGETLLFPEYVANYLFKIYPFLEIIGEEIEEKTESVVSTTSTDEEVTIPKPAKSKEGIIHCNTCGQNFKNSKGFALHISFKHPELLNNL